MERYKSSSEDEGSQGESELSKETIQVAGRIVGEEREALNEKLSRYQGLTKLGSALAQGGLGLVSSNMVIHMMRSAASGESNMASYWAGAGIGVGVSIFGAGLVTRGSMMSQRIKQKLGGSR